MINQQLLDYIKQQIEKGIETEEINRSLIANGWQVPDIKQAFDLIIKSNKSNSINVLSPQSIPYSPKQKKESTKSLIVSFLIVIFFMISGGVFAYFNYFQTPSPEKIFQKIINNFSNVNYLEYSGEVKIETNVSDLLGGMDLFQQTKKDTENSTSNLSINFNGVSDTNDLSKPKASFSFDIGTDALSNSNIFFGLDVRFADGVFYIRPNNLPNLGFFDVTMLSGQWIEIDTTDLVEETKGEKTKKTQSLGLSPEKIQIIKILLEQYKFFKITENLAIEKIDGVRTHHLKFAIDKEESKKLLIEIGRVIQGKALEEDELKEIDKNFETLESIEGEVWIGIKDLLPYKISLNPIMMDSEEADNNGKINFVLSFKNFNKPVQIEIPTYTKTIEEIFRLLMGNMSGGGLPKSSLPTPNTR